jgi:hypothetical protein
MSLKDADSLKKHFERMKLPLMTIGTHEMTLPHFFLLLSSSIKDTNYFKKIQKTSSVT